MDSIVDKVQEQYNRQAQLYAQSRSHATGDTLGLLLEWGEPLPHYHVLDVATGTGFTAFTFASHVAQVVALDLTQGMLAQAIRLGDERGLVNLSFVQGAAEALPFPDGAFHLVTCRIAPHHFFSVERFLKEVRRVLKPGGKFLMADTSTSEEPLVNRWQNYVEKLRDPSHQQNYTPSEWTALLEGAGFVVLRTTTEYRTHLTFLDWVNRSGNDPETVHKLRALFEEASPGAKEAFQIQPQGEDIAFSWIVFASESC